MNTIIQNAVSTIRNSSLNRLTIVNNHFVAKIPERCLSCVTAGTKPNIQVSRSRALVDESVCVSVSGLHPGQKVTLQTFVDKGPKSFGSCGHYIADDDGSVDTFKHICHGGTFDGFEPMGLFWSMKSLPGQQSRRILNYDVTQPFNIKLFVIPNFVQFEELIWSEERSSLSQCNFAQMFMNPDVQCIPVRENGIVGTLFLPKGEGPFPAVTDMFGMAGADPSHRSSLLASRGIASFMIMYIGHEGIAQSSEELNFHYFLKAFDWLASHPKVDANAMGGLGSCVGAFFTSLIAWKRPQMKCLVAINNPLTPSAPAQELEGEIVESTWPWEISKLPIQDGALKVKDLMGWDEYVQIQSIPYWRHGLKVLNIQGEDDQCVHPDFTRALHERVPQEFAKNFELIRYPGTGHIIEPPYFPLCRSNYNSLIGVKLLWGGEPKRHAHAQIDSWPRIIAFFQKHLNTR